MSVAAVNPLVQLQGGGSPQGATEEVIQPSKEWVLPARGKPGRKPAATVPLTKRKAQNRASQRAFRERRHAYLAELEEKVARYEAREIDANVQMQRIALQCREEAAHLRQKNEALGARCEHLEKQLRVLSTRSSSGTSPRTPHDLPVNTPKLGLIKQEDQAPRRPSGIRHTSASPDNMQETSEDEPFAPLLMTRGGSVAGENVDLRFDCGFCPDQGLCVCRGKARLDFDEDGGNVPPTPGAPLQSAMPVQPGSAAVPLSRNQLRKTRLWPTQAGSPGMTMDMPMNAGSPMSPRMSAPWAPSPAGSMRLAPSPVSSVRLAASPGGARMRPVVPRPRPRLWSISEPEQSKPTQSPRNVRTPMGYASAGSPGSALHQDYLATEDDPALQEFYSAVSRNVKHPVSTQRKESAASPPMAMGNPALAPSLGAKESVPQAFRRLRNHPNFTKFSGGLETLADVVTRGVSEEQGASRKTAPELEKGTDIKAPNGAAVTKSALQTAAPSAAAILTAPTPPSMYSLRRTAHAEDEGMHERRKRMRVNMSEMYVRSEAVSEALKMLDRPKSDALTQEDEAQSAASPSAASVTTPSSRLPWPRR
ncbi:hypothetical protein MVES_001977 [Malassezia vespertilionis]|uniref:BZIP domain-containing protein n=1 Tax=Malassezia vespertilionis TaxID=2020962 RepID=A0A2N1JB33_9BASI|nr:hypothetical protein MVES_001977 [Malassezia vespertilionis]